MPAIPKDIYVEQGATFRLTWDLYHQAVDPDTGDPLWDDVDETIPTLGDPYDFTGCTARAQARPTPSSETLWLTASTDDGDGIDLGPGPAISLEFSDEKSEAMGTFSRDKKGGWDFKLYWPSGDDERVLEGACVVSPSFTKDAVAP